MAREERWLLEARERLGSLRTFAAQVEDGERSGDLGALLAADAQASATLALVEALRDGVVYVANAHAI